MLEQVLGQLDSLSKEAMQVARNRIDHLSKPLGSLGKLETYCIQLAGIYNTANIDISKKVVIAFAGDHGIYDEGVARDPQIITKCQIPNFAKGICGVGTLAQFIGVDVVAVDVGVKCNEPLEGVLPYKIREGTWNFAKGPAMTREEAVRSIEIGIEMVTNCVQEGYKIIAIGEMGIANTTPTSAIVSVFAACDPKEVTGKGAGLDEEQVVHKANVIREAIKLNKPDREDALDILTKVGGFEIGAMAGAIIGAAANKVPVVLDGFISYGAALLAYSLAPVCKEYMIASHASAELGTSKALELLGLEAPLHLDMRLGEGSGGILMFKILEAACYLYNNMATREESNC